MLTHRVGVARSHAGVDRNNIDDKKMLIALVARSPAGWIETVMLDLCRSSVQRTNSG